MRTRSLIAPLLLLTTGTVIGATTQHFASAGVSSGDRPVLISITPCRLADTRPAPQTVGPRSDPLAAADTHTLDVFQTGVPCTGKIPAEASAVSLNITALNATEQSFLTVWAGGTRPTAASLNPAPGQPPVPNAVTTDISSDGGFDIYNDRGTVNVVVDVNGYYVDHDHDDRYYSKAQSDSRFAPIAPAPTFVQPRLSDYRLGGEWDVGEALTSAMPPNESCLSASIDVPEGSTVTDVVVNYSATASAIARFYVFGLRTSTGPISTTRGVMNLVESGATLPVTGQFVIGSVTVVHDPNDGSPFFPYGTVEGPDHDNTLRFCTPDVVTVYSLRVTFETP